MVKNLDLISRLFSLFVFSILIIYIMYSISVVDKKSSEERAEKIQTVIERALIQCYALEGSYPSEEKFEATMERYGVKLNTNKYIYYYSVIGSNIKPEIMVSEIDSERGFLNVE